MVPGRIVPFDPLTGDTENASPEQVVVEMLLTTDIGLTLTYTLFVSTHPMAVIVSVNVYQPESVD